LIFLSIIYLGLPAAAGWSFLHVQCPMCVFVCGGFVKCEWWAGGQRSRASSHLRGAVLIGIVGIEQAAYIYNYICTPNIHIYANSSSVIFWTAYANQ
jgi:hypothetical protein